MEERERELRTNLNNRTWCPNGALDPTRHIYADPTPLNNEQLLPPLTDGQWLSLIAPSQSGKTTRTLALQSQLQAQGFAAI